MPIPTQQNVKIVKPGDDPLQLDTVHKEDRYGRFTFPHVIQEHILNILRFLVGHGHNPSFLVWEFRLNQMSDGSWHGRRICYSSSPSSSREVT
jgi:hypothetical protein